MTIAQLIEHEHLPADFSATVDRYYRPLAERLTDWVKVKPQVFGINGGQGTGKSTMATFLKAILELDHGLQVAVFSIDDLYLPRAERQRLAGEIHPLLVTRGVPGTHDAVMGLQVIESLLNAGPETLTPLPRFSKSADDRVPVEDWPVIKGRADVVIVEGWCVGATAQDAEELETPVNQLEQHEDPDGAWRSHVNEHLSGDYGALFAVIDHLVMLKAPSMACVRAWRGEQEAKLRAKLELQGSPLDEVMAESEIDRFVQHFQRLTEHQWRVLTKRADTVLRLAEDHSIVGIEWKEKEQ